MCFSSAVFGQSGCVVLRRNWIRTRIGSGDYLIRQIYAQPHINSSIRASGSFLEAGKPAVES
jgi:hypothetical protein